MFHVVTNASKVGLAVSIDTLFRAGIELFDVQFVTEHLASLGAYEVSRGEYLARVARATPRQVPALAISAALDGWAVAYHAGNYARLYPAPAHEACDVRHVIREIIGRLGAPGTTDLRADLAEDLPLVCTDQLVLRRILENLVGNRMPVADVSVRKPASSSCPTLLVPARPRAVEIA